MYNAIDLYHTVFVYNIFCEQHTVLAYKCYSVFVIDDHYLSVVTWFQPHLFCNRIANPVDNNMKLSAVSVFVFAAACCLCGHAKSPNMIFMLMDDVSLINYECHYVEICSCHMY